jgi:dTMP kinase
MGLFITIEGCDASGKHTQSKLLAEFLRSKLSQPVTEMAFPNYSTPVGKLIKGHLKGLWACTLSPEGLLAEEGGELLPRHTNALVYQALQSANRAEMKKELLSALVKGHVVCDRYLFSSYAYGMAAGIDLHDLVAIGEASIQPDLNILLDVSLEDTFQRRPERRDILERNAEMMGKVIQAYRSYWDTMCAKDHYGWEVVNARGSIQETQTLIRAKVSEYAYLDNGLSAKSGR